MIPATHPHPSNYYRLHHKKVLWYMNISQEQNWGRSSYFPAMHDPQAQDIIVQQEHQLLFLARPEDTVFFHKMPEPIFLRYWEERGVTLPRIICFDDISELPDLSGYTLIPFIMTDELMELKLRFPQLEVIAPELQVCKEINHKFKTRRLMEKNGFKVTTGFFCTTVQELEEAYRRLVSSGFAKCVLKVPYGSSGKGLKVIEHERNFQSLCRYIEHRETDIDLLIEGWHNHRLSLTAQLFITDEQVHILALTEQMIDQHGVYKGTNFSPALTPPELASYQEQLLKIGAILRQMGYYGVLGIDSIIDTNGDLIPVIEINARLTQVTYILPLVIEQKKRHAFVESRVVVFNSKADLSFEDYVRHMTKLTDDFRVKIDVYNFCKAAGASKNTYKIFLLVSTNKPERLTSVRSALDELNVQISTGVQ
ncbi:ATP-grasp domain-containing protein [Paenibacillus sp. MZ04-78.2]|uniref:ATP-grasp domain-containing protein n=1 Tax=Paenibacillus sp. MZ04-78.2 TaxID=2962034 RepID=UPI0020B7BE7B|nr:ATP-grasp domain-containing protein [Paenibacillus sp. MZ04-78.2]MCP3774496.1 ATP-grasp domain-containing protein [Paenibacillus sp. MZ04-78.2]